MKWNFKTCLHRRVEMKFSEMFNSSTKVKWSEMKRNKCNFMKFQRDKTQKSNQQFIELYTKSIFVNYELCQTSWSCFWSTSPPPHFPRLLAPSSDCFNALLICSGHFWKVLLVHINIVLNHLLRRLRLDRYKRVYTPCPSENKHTYWRFHSSHKKFSVTSLSPFFILMQ